MYDFAKSTNSELAECGSNLRSATSEASSMEKVATRVKEAVEPFVGAKIAGPGRH